MNQLINLQQDEQNRDSRFSELNSPGLGLELLLYVCVCMYVRGMYVCIIRMYV